MIAAKIPNVKLVEVTTAESTICGLAQEKVLGILAEQLHASVGRNSINAVGSVRGHVEISTSVKCEPIGHARKTLGVHLGRTGGAVRLNFKAHHAIQIAFHHVEVTLGCVQRQSIRKMEGSCREQLCASVHAQTINDSVRLLPLPGIAEIEVALGVKHTEVGIHEFPAFSGIGYDSDLALLCDLDQGSFATVTNVDVVLPIDCDSETEAARACQDLRLLAVARDAVDLPGLTARIERPIAGHRDTFRMIESGDEIPNLRNRVQHESPRRCRA